MGTLGLFCSLVLLGTAKEPVIKHSDVAFMGEASPSIYRQYGATVLAWGGLPNPQALRDAAGVRWFGSVGMVTEFSGYYERFPSTYEQGLCRDIDGKPVKVPWLTDLNHKGIPYWWCCTQQPLFRQYLRERVIATMKAGADGLHVDDHLGTSGGLWLGTCFCDRCVEGFRAYLKTLPAAELARLGITDPSTYDFRAAERAWLAEGAGKRRVTDHPLWSQWVIYQHRAAADLMMELRALAAKTSGHPVPVGANAGLLWGGHLSDYHAVDLFVAETDHDASSRRPTDSPIVAYRMAEAVGRPYASTASGGDWAFIKANNLPGLVRTWIALSYAAGQRLMAPNHQWCYTPEKGTHWYDGPADRFAPLYRFVREHAGLFDSYDTYTDIAVAIPMRSFTADAGKWIRLCGRLADANIAYSIVLGGDEMVDHPLPASELSAAHRILSPEPGAFLPADRKRLDTRMKRGHVFATVEEATKDLVPAVQVSAESTVRAFARVRKGSAVVHLLNYAYDAKQDDVTTLRNVAVTVDLAALGVEGVRTCRLEAPGADPVVLRVDRDRVQVPSLGLWGVLVFAER